MFQEKLEIEVNFKVRILGLLEFLNQKIILTTMCISFSLFKVKWNTSNFQKHLKLESHQENTEDEFDSNQRRYREDEGDEENNVRHRSTTTIVE